jgi:hypothetical protein
MWQALFFALVAVGALVAASDWRRAVPLVVLAGVLQDPVRKLTPGAPAYLVLGFLPVWLVVVGQAFREDPSPWDRLRRAHPRLTQAMLWFLLALVPGAIVVLQYGLPGVRLAAIGAMGYVFPVLALLVGYALLRDARHLRRVLAWYCVFISIALVGGVLEFLQVFPESPVLGTSALGTTWVRHITWGHGVKLMSGIFRSPDLMGWHAATLVMLALTLAASGRPGARWGWGLAAVWGAFVVLLSGRTKMTLMPVVWAAVAILAMLRAGRSTSVMRLAFVGCLLLAVGLIAGSRMFGETDYVLNATRSSEGAVGRLHRESIGAVETTLLQSGFWGEGLGFASQGRQHLGVEVKGGWQESGPSKILVELGVPGLVAGLFLAWTMLVAIRGSAVPASADPRGVDLQVCLFAFTAANVACFAVSHQAFSDGTVIIMNGLLLGASLSAPRWESRAPEPGPSVRAPRETVVPSASWRVLERPSPT